MANMVVARFADGHMLKGTSLDVDPARPKCHIRTADGMHEVTLADLKALFFVKSLDGDATHVEGREIAPVDPRLRGSKLVEVSFRDGEKVVGLCMRYPPKLPFFFLVPVDATSNNVRILINGDQLAGMQLVEPAK